MSFYDSTGAVPNLTLFSTLSLSFSFGSWEISTNKSENHTFGVQIETKSTRYAAIQIFQGIR